MIARAILTPSTRLASREAGKTVNYGDSSFSVSECGGRVKHRASFRPKLRPSPGAVRNIYQPSTVAGSSRTASVNCTNTSQSGLTETGGLGVLRLARYVRLAFLATAHLLSREDRFRTDAEMTRGDTDLHRAKHRCVGQDVVLLAQKDEAIRLHGLHVVDRQVLLGAADQTGGQVHFVPFDKYVRLDADAVDGWPTSFHPRWVRDSSVVWCHNRVPHV